MKRKSSPVTLTKNNPPSTKVKTLQELTNLPVSHEVLVDSACVGQVNCLTPFSTLPLLSLLELNGGSLGFGIPYNVAMAIFIIFKVVVL